LPWNPTIYCLTSAFFAIALWLSLDLTAQVWFTFKKHKRLYCWAILITTWGIAGHAIAFIFKLFVPGHNVIGSTILGKISWVANTTGFSVVLYSRLHLVIRSPGLLRTVLVFIIADAFLFHTPVIVFSFAMDGPNPARWVPYMNVAERIQVIGFTLQELVISTIYTYSAAKFLRGGYSHQLRNILIFLVLAQVLIFSSDMVMVVTDYLDMFTLKASLHPFIYALKLKIEFVVLNQLRHLV
ncbi:hypothetical protein K402DRAFT_306200, partial [Aulographum hederae CBS 113979]